MRIITYLLLCTFLITSCSKDNLSTSKDNLSNSNLSACDCVKMLDRYTLYGLGKSEWNWDKAKKCVDEYSNESEIYKKASHEAQDVDQFMIFAGRNALEIAQKDCFENRTYSDAQKAKACDCYSVSVTVAGAYDNLTSSQQKLREDCTEIFGAGDDKILKNICDSNK